MTETGTEITIEKQETLDDGLQLIQLTVKELEQLNTFPTMLEF